MEERVSILITPDGACLLSGDRDNLVMDQIAKGDITLARIVKNTGMPKSTVFSILDKLASYGIIDSYLDDDGMRWYTATSSRIINLRKPMLMPDIMERRWNRHISSDMSEPIPKICYMALMSAPESSGVDTSPIYLDLGRRLGEEIVRTSRPSEAVGSAMSFLKHAGMCDIKYVGKGREEHTFQVTFKNLLFDKSARLVCCTVASLMKTLLNIVNGTDLDIRSIKPVPYTTVYEIVLSTYGRMFPEGKPFDDVPSVGPVGNRPQMYMTDNGAECITGIQSQIMDLMMHRCTMQKDLAHMLGVPTSTVSFNMRRLIERGLVERDKQGYRVIATPSVKWCEPQRMYRHVTDMYIRRCISEPDYIHRYLLAFSITNGMRMGIDIRPVLYNTGAALAHILISHIPDADLDAMMKIVDSNHYWIQDCCARVIRKDPLTFILRVGYNMDDLMSEYINVFHQHFFRVVVQHLCGKEYDVLSSNYFGVGNRVHIIRFGRIEER